VSQPQEKQTRRAFPRIRDLSTPQTRERSGLVIVGSLLVSLDSTHGNEACDALTPLGWDVEVEAASGEFVEFETSVLDERLGEGWDAAVVFLGNNYRENKLLFQLELSSILLRLYPRPTVLITTSLYRGAQMQVNDALHEFDSQYDNVSLIDWSTISTDPAFTGDDNLHLRFAGQRRLADELASAAGTPITGRAGICLH